MTSLTLLILATNLALLYFVFNISQLMRQILSRLETTASPSPEFPVSVERWSHWRWSQWGPLELRGISHVRECAATALSFGFPPHPLSKVRYFPIWCWSGGQWRLDPSSVPAGCEAGSEPNFTGDYEGQYVKTEGGLKNR
jgi:hypothetical protein